MKKQKFFSAKNVAYLAVLLALVIVLQVFASMIPVGGAQLNFSLIPIVLGAILLGPAGGAFLGFACGVVVLIQVITLPTVPFYAVIWTYSPVVTTFTCILKTTVAGMNGAITGHMDMNGMNLLVFILVGLVTFNFFIELALNLVIAPAIHRVVLLVEHTVTGRKKTAEQVSDQTPLSEENETEEHDDHLH